MSTGVGTLHQSTQALSTRWGVGKGVDRGELWSRPDVAGSETPRSESIVRVKIVPAE
jgi:hypothetical protein